MPDRIPNVLTIAGVDPSGGAGVLADVKTMSALRAYACAVVTAPKSPATRPATAKSFMVSPLCFRCSC